MPYSVLYFDVPTMHTCIYLPCTGLLRKRFEKDAFTPLVGYCVGSTYVVIDYMSDLLTNLQPVDPNLLIIGYIVNGTPPTKRPAASLFLRYDGRSQYPVVDSKFTRSDYPCTVVVFSPPNLRNLEYYTINPVLLQGAETDSQTDQLYRKVDRHRRYSEPDGAIYLIDERVLERINNCQTIRIQLQDFQKASHRNSWAFKNGLLWILGSSQFFLATFARLLITQVLTFFVAVICILNHRIYDVTPVLISSTCRQLDLRLRQLSFLPIQFLCYYKGDVLSEQLRAKLKLSFPNENHNIKNSNYINFYNSLWLILNDVILGRVFYNIWRANNCLFLDVLQKFRSLVFTELSKIISWVGTDYPAGFKLNNDLGQFMEAMLLWTSRTWFLLIDVGTKLCEAIPAIDWASGAIFYCFCTCGFSFVLAFFIDYVKLASLHITFFNISTSKIYNQQIEMLKSLMQLFRGKKYNVLRSRIDSIEKDDYRIDQLLLGTFCFMILIYLIPTTFAFYFLFFATEVGFLTLTKLGEKVIVVLNLFPIFVVMLKLKNSRRLQGGVYFESKGSLRNTNWLIMRNKALTFDNILGPFVTVFRQQGRILRLSFNFIEGKRLEVQNCILMKFRYLMLPEDYSELLEAWNSIQ